MPELPAKFSNRPGVHQQFGAQIGGYEGIILVTSDHVYQMIIVGDGSYDYKKINVNMEFPRVAFVSVIVPFDEYC